MDLAVKWAFPKAVYNVLSGDIRKSRKAPSVLVLSFFMLSSFSTLSDFSAFENVHLSGSHMKVNNDSFDHRLRLKSNGLDICPSTAIEQADMVLFLLAHSQRAEKVAQPLVATICSC